MAPDANNIHATLSDSPFPYTDDIALTPVTLTGPNSSNWTTLASGCVGLVESGDPLGRNLRGTESFNALLRAYVRIASATAATGARYEIQLMVDGQIWADYARRIRGSYPDGDYFEAITFGSAGHHSYSVRALLLDSGTITFDTVWINGQGAPSATYPAVQSNPFSVVTVGTSWVLVSDSLSLNVATSVDVFPSIFFQVNTATATSLDLQFRIDGIAQHQSSIAVPASLPDTTRATDHSLAVQPGNHTVELWAKTNTGTASLQYRNLRFVTLPPNTPVRDAIAFGTLHTDNTNTGPQPQPVTGITTYCGQWNQLLEMGVPQIPFTANDTTEVTATLDAYVQILGNLSGTTPAANVAFEITYPNGTGGTTGTDLGWTNVIASNTPSGLYHFGDGLKVHPFTADGGTLRLWIRKQNALCGGDAGTGFDVGQRYMAIKFVPAHACHFH